jgi:hypothetical protein
MTKNNNIEIETTTENSISQIKPTSKHRKSWILNLLAVLIGFAMIGGVLCVLDILAQRELRKTGEALPKICLYRSTKKITQQNMMTVQDLLLGVRHDIKTCFPNLVENHLPYIIADKFKIFIRESDLTKFPSHSRMEDIGMTPDLVAKLERPIIVCLGGSTTFAFQTGSLPTGDIEATGSWSEELSRIMENKKICGTVFCGGTSGYKTSQDLLKLIRDVLEIKPDIVISYGGFNDFFTITHGYHLYHGYPFQLHQQKKNLSDASFILPNLIRYTRKKIMLAQSQSDKHEMYDDEYWYWGIKSEMSLHEYLIRNWKIMNEICKLHDIKFYGVLQPCVGSTEITRNNDEILTEKTRDHYLNHKFVSLEQLFNCYDQVRLNLTQYSYIHDFSNIFDEQSPETIYIYSFSCGYIRDTAHVNQKGNRIVADNVFKMLFDDKK